MKKLIGFYLIVTIVYAAMLMQRTAELQGGYVSVDYLRCLLFLLKRTDVAVGNPTLVVLALTLNLMITLPDSNRESEALLR